MSATARPELAVLVLAHRSPEQVRALLRGLASPRVALFLHLDTVAGPPGPFLPDGVPVTLVRRRRCRWGESAVVRATLDLVRTARSVAPSARYLALVSGQCWPVTDVDDLADRYARDPFAGHLSVVRLPADDLPGGGWPRLTGYRVPAGLRPAWLHRAATRVAARLPERSRRHLPAQAWYGSQWWDLRADVADHLLAQVEADPALLRRLRWTTCADELFVQSLVMSSPLADEVEVTTDPARSLFGTRYIDWAHAVDGHPRVLDDVDLPLARRAGATFARKLERVPTAPAGQPPFSKTMSTQ